MFGDGHDYDWALVEDDDEAVLFQDPKDRTRYIDVSPLYSLVGIN